jgi:hypothetical protein
VLPPPTIMFWYNKFSKLFGHLPIDYYIISLIPASFIPISYGLNNTSGTVNLSFDNFIV